MMRSPLQALLLLAVVFTSACLAPPPPIVVDTPFGEVRAESETKAREIAGLLEDLSPRVSELLPGSQERSVDVWVQDELAVYRNRTRPESVRGFTLLVDEFHAKRIHLQAEGRRSPWYLAHELVHALIGPSWKPLPGILEEGLGDVIAEQLNGDYAEHIRAHRLLNASAVTGGFQVNLAHSQPVRSQRRHQRWPRQVSSTLVQPAERVDIETIRHLLSTSRSNLHEEWPEIPESFYGFAWLLVSRIQERHGLEHLHDLCARAEEEGLELISDWLFEAAEMDLESLDAEFLTSCLGPSEMRAAAYLQAELFGNLALDLSSTYQARTTAGFFLYRIRPALRLHDGSEIPLFRVGPIHDHIRRNWRQPRRATSSLSAPID